jgi:hypothetical protein
MQPMGPLRPRLLTPSAIPVHWPLIVDLKDCFFTIPLWEEDKEKFAFSVLTFNHKELLKNTINGYVFHRG